MPYDNMDTPQRRTDALGRTDIFAYDLNGNLTCLTDRRGQISVLKYDALERPVFAAYGASNCAADTYDNSISYSFDGASRPTSIIDSSSGTITPVFDSLDRLTSVSTVPLENLEAPERTEVILLS